MPSLLSLTRKLNVEKNLGLSRTEVIRAASVMEKRCDGWSQVDAEAYVLQYWDETGELAVQHVQRERNKAAAARRLAA